MFNTDGIGPGVSTVLCIVMYCQMVIIGFIWDLETCN